MKATTLFLMVFGKLAFGWTLVSQGIAGWPTRELVIHVNPTDCTVAEATLNDIIDRAIASWNGIPTTSLTLKRDTTPSTVTVSEFLAGTAADTPVFLCDPRFGTSNNVDANFIPAATRMSFSGGRISYAGILLNAQAGAEADISRLSSDQLAITLAHELGHVLGLGHSGTKEALMYYSISDKAQALLTSDDTDGLTHLYPRNEFQANPFGCAAVKGESRHSSFPLGVLVFPFWLLLCLVAGRVLRRKDARIGCVKTTEDKALGNLFGASH